MKVIVLGSGVVGLTSAWYLAQAGCEVTVIDRQRASAQETSFANAGQLSYGYSSPWAAPGVPFKAVKWMLSAHSPLVINPQLSLPMYQWMYALLTNCQASHYTINKQRMLALANYSRQCLSQLREDTGICYQERQQGTLQVLRTMQQVDALDKDIQLLTASEVNFKLLSKKECINIEPALAFSTCDIAAGLQLPDDETGDCEAFCQQLTALAINDGVRFEFDVDIEKLVFNDNVICGVKTNKGMFTADNYVVALGSYSTAMLSPLGINMPVYPVKGYSLTLPIKDEDRAPQSTVMDETHKVALTRFDSRLRVAGTAQLCGFDLSIPDKRTSTLIKVVTDLFPQVGDLNDAQYWTGLRPMTPDGTPIIGKTSFKNLFTNTGHGTLGWTMACGSAKFLTDCMLGADSAINQDDYGVCRYGSFN